MAKTGQFLNGVSPLTEHDLNVVNESVDDCFDYHEWTDAQKAQGVEVREALKTAVKVIINNVPPSADRSVAIRKLREARMDANSAITHGGRY